MDGKELISPSDAHLQQQQPFYTQHQHRMQHQLAGAAAAAQHQHQHHQHQQQHNNNNNNHHHSSPLSAGMHHSVIRPMPNMSMSPTAILQSIGGMQFQMDAAPSPSQQQQQQSSSTLMHNAMQQQQQQQGSVVSVSGSGAMPTQQLIPEPVIKRKRGRPRKYGPDGAMKAAASSIAAAQAQQQQMMSAPPRMGSMPGGHVDMAGLEDSAQMKKRRGRPPGTGKKLSSSPVGKLPGTSSGNAFAGSAGTSFTPHIITASPSEDVAGKIAAFANQSPRAVCVLSAMGSVSRVVLRHPADHHHAAAVSRPLLLHHHAAASAPPYKNPAVYEGLYEILSLSGSYNLHEGGGAAQQQTESQQEGDGLSVTLCSPERHVIGGVLAGALVAATTVQVVLGSFVHGGSRAKSKKAGKQLAAFSADSLTSGGQDASPSSAGHVNQSSLTPPSIMTTGGGWPSSGIFDTRSSNIDINSSRG